MKQPREFIPVLQTILECDERSSHFLENSLFVLAYLDPKIEADSVFTLNDRLDGLEDYCHVEKPKASNQASPTNLIIPKPQRGAFFHLNTSEASSKEQNPKKNAHYK